MNTLAAVIADEEIRKLVPPLRVTQGMVFAVAASPEIPMPETWMPWLVSGTGTLARPKVDMLAEGLMNELRNVLQSMRDNSQLLPADLKDSGEKAVQQWLTGLLDGHQRLEPCWQRAWNEAAWKAPEPVESPAKRLRRCLKFFSVLADTELAMRSRTREEAAVLAKSLPQLYNQLPAMLHEYVSLAGELAKSLPNQFESVAGTNANVD